MNHYRKSTTSSGRNIESFRETYDSLRQDDQSNAIQILFWQLNDTIYRFIVLEWLVEYAEECESEKIRKCESTKKGPTNNQQPTTNNKTEPFRLHLYGNQWHEHPTFAKYDRGSIQHEEELSIAYQAAKFSLHLNPQEGSHQRLFEIIASGGVPITRCKNKHNLISSDLTSALRKLAEQLFSDETPSTSYNDKEQAALNDLVFSLSNTVLNQNSGLSLTELEQEVEQRLIQRLTNNPDWLLDNWRDLNFQSKDQLAQLL